VVLLRSEGGLYLGLILAWAAPVLALQWAYGGHVLWAARRSLLLGVAVPTLYLWVTDRLALGFGIWFISERYTTGFGVLGMPVEEAVFFAITTLMVVQGLLLFLWVCERLRGRRDRKEPPGRRTKPARATSPTGAPPCGTAPDAGTPR
jgi:lycopene cyclase domain-containing protein